MHFTAQIWVTRVPCEGLVLRLTCRLCGACLVCLSAQHLFKEYMAAIEPYTPSPTEYQQLQNAFGERVIGAVPFESIDGVGTPLTTDGEDLEVTADNLPWFQVLPSCRMRTCPMWTCLLLFKNAYLGVDLPNVGLFAWWQVLALRRKIFGEASCGRRSLVAALSEGRPIPLYTVISPLYRGVYTQRPNPLYTVGRSAHLGRGGCCCTTRHAT